MVQRALKPLLIKRFLKAAMQKIEAIASSPVDGDYEDMDIGNASFSRTKVKGKNVEEMLLDYAKKQSCRF